MAVTGQTPTRLHLDATTAPAAPAGYVNGVWQAGAAYPDPNDGNYAVRDADNYYPNIAGIDARTTTSEAILQASLGKLVTFNNGSAVAATLPHATTLPGIFWISAKNLGAGLVTITPATSTIDGAATITLSQGEWALIFSDGTNYFTLKHSAFVLAQTIASVTHKFLNSYDAATGLFTAAQPALTDDSDVLLTSAADNDVLTYEASSSKWKNKPTASGSGTVTHTGAALTAHRVVVGNGTDDVEVIAALGTAGQYLRSGGAGVDPAFGSIAESEVTGLVSDLAAKGNVADGGLANHGVAIGDSTSHEIKSVGTGTAGQYLRSGGSSADPAMASIAESEVTNLVSDLALKAPLASPALTGTPTAPTAAIGTNTTQLATTAFVTAAGVGGGLVPGAGTMYLRDDFMGGGSTSGTVGELGWLFNGGGGNFVLPSNDTADHPGYVEIGSGTNSNGWEFLVLRDINATHAIHELDNATFDASFVVAVQATLGDQIARVGFTTNSGTQNPTNGIYFELNITGGSGNWKCICRKASSDTSVDSLVAVSAAAWVNFRITGDGSNITFFINGSQVAQTAVANAPTTAMTPMVQTSNVTTNLANKRIWVDFFMMTMTVTR